MAVPEQRYHRYPETVIPIVLQANVPEPLSVQIASEIRRLVAAGALESGEPVPSSRALAHQLSVSRGTVVAAYDQLISESYLVATPGGKTRIHPHATARPTTQQMRQHTARSLRSQSASSTASTASTGNPAQSGSGPSQATTMSTQERAGTGPDRRKENAPEVRAATSPSRPNHSDTPANPARDLRPTGHAPTIINDSSWREAWRAAATPATNYQPQPGETQQGLLELREAIAEHLRLMRSMVVDPQDIFVTTGARDGLALTLLAMDVRDQAIGVESPGYPGLRRVIARAGLTTADLPVDAHGVISTDLPPGDQALAALLVTPNHLFPVGGSMPAPRRFELLASAEAHGILVIEDDLDSEYRHVGAVVPSLWELAPQSVAHLGTFNQVLTSDARMGYLIAPQRLHAGLLAARGDLGSGASAIAQRALATYLRGGGLRRHLIRRRREVVRRRDFVAGALGRYGAQTRAGAHAIIKLPSLELSEQVRAQCAARGVLIGDLAAYWSSPALAPVAGIVISYGDLIFDDMARSVEIVASVLAEHEDALPLEY